MEERGKTCVQEFLIAGVDEPTEVIVDLQSILDKHNDTNLHLYLKSFIDVALDDASRDKAIRIAKVLCDLVVKKIIPEAKVIEA